MTRAGQEERIRAINAAALQTPLTAAQRNLLDELYAGQVMVPGAVSGHTWAPPGWRGSAGDQEVFDKVVKPYCTTCHLALQSALDGSVHPSHALFLAASDLRGYPLQTVLCGAFTMPNAQPTMINFWDPPGGDPINVGGTVFNSAADAMLAWTGLDRGRCALLKVVQTCNRGLDPDALCGGIASGTACNRVTGRCLPEFDNGPNGTVARGPRGFCRTDGKRGCPRPFSCVATTDLGPGLESFDGVCAPPPVSAQHL
jgi:hypothetical protein